MKGVVAAAAVAAMAGTATAMDHHQAHQLFAKRHEGEDSASCTVYTTVLTGEAARQYLATASPSSSSSSSSTSTSTSIVTPVTPTTPVSVAPVTPTSVATPVAPTTSVKLPVPTPEPYNCPTPGVYTFPATTVVVSQSTTAVVQTSTHVTPGVHTIGGHTTVVEAPTTVTCPVIVTGEVTSTVYYCPSAGTYTVGPITTSVTQETDVVYPVPTEYAPGTYTAPETVVTATETSTVYYCPYTSSSLSTSTPAPAPQTTVVPQAPSVSTVAPSSSSEAPVSTVSVPAVAKPSPQPPKAPSGGFQGSWGGNGDHYGITYTPYDGDSGSCKSADQVDKDISDIKNSGFSVIRVYSTDCDTLPSVGDACKKHGVSIILGIFVKESGCSYDVPEIKEQIDAIAEWSAWDIVELLVVGNEAIMNGYCKPSELKTLIQTVKSKCSGYSGPFTIAETLNIWQRSDVTSTLCGDIDFTGANIHPFFNSGVTADQAGDFVKGQLDILDEVCPGKKAVNLECGWPTEGECNGSACPGKQEQVTALKSIRESCGSKTVFFSYVNDLWKEPGQFGCEQSWGAKSYFASISIDINISV